MAVKVNRAGRLNRQVAGEFTEFESEVRNSGQYFSKLTRKVRELEVLITGGGNTVTVTGAIPAGGVIVLAVVAKVINAITGSGGLATFSLGPAAAPTRYGTGKAIAAGTLVDIPDYLAAMAGPLYYAAATDLVFTANGAETFTSGKVRLGIIYEEATPPSR